MTGERSVEKYLEMIVEKNLVSIHLSQSFLIQRILEAIGGMEKLNV